MAMRSRTATNRMTRMRVSMYVVSAAPSAAPIIPGMIRQPAAVYRIFFWRAQQNAAAAEAQTVAARLVPTAIRWSRPKIRVRGGT